MPPAMTTDTEIATTHSQRVRPPASTAKSAMPISPAPAIAAAVTRK